MGGARHYHAGMMRPPMRPAWPLLLPLSLALSGAVLLLGGCQLQKTRTVKAQYHDLGRHQVAVLAMVPPNSDDPTAGPLVAELVTRQLQAKVEGIRVVPAGKIRAWSQANPYWMLQPLSKVTGELGADALVVVDISQLSISDPNSQLLKGVVSGRVKLHLTESRDIETPAFSTIISAEWPKTGNTQGVPEDFHGISWPVARDRTVQWFSYRAAGVFFDHEEPK